jgi:hypothetical protein
MRPLDISEATAAANRRPRPRRVASRDDGREKKLLADTGVALAFLRGCAGVHRPGRVDSYFVSVSDNTTRNSNGWPRMELRSARRANARLAALGVSNHLSLRARRPLHPAPRLSLHRRKPPLYARPRWRPHILGTPRLFKRRRCSSAHTRHSSAAHTRRAPASLGNYSLLPRPGSPGG